MALTPQQTATAPGKPAFSWLRAIRFPLIVLVVFGGIFAIPWICLALGVETEGALPLIMFTQWFGPALAVLLVGVWWLFFSAFRWTIRLGVIFAIVALVSVGFTFCLREVELTMGRVGLVPRFHYVWDRTAILAEKEDGQEIYDYVGPNDFPRFRGANADGVVKATLETDWEKSPPSVLWKHDCPGGYSGVAVAGNMVVTLEQRDDKETVVCYDRSNGRQHWAYAYDAHYKDRDKMGNGPRSTPTIHKGRVYTIGATGVLLCLDSAGKKIWSANILDDARAKNIKWGLTASPLIVDDLVIALAGIDEDAPADSSVIAYELAEGKIRWRTGKRLASYSSPQLATLGGVTQILLFDAVGLVSYEPKTGKELWQFPWITDYNMNSIQPVVLGSDRVVLGIDRVFISSELKNGCAMLRVKPPQSEKAAWSVEVAWQNKNLASRYANPVSNGESIFGLHNYQGVLTCLDADTGKVKWKGDREGPGQLLLADNALIVVNGETGDVALFDTEAGTELGRHQTFDKRDKTWNTPALAGDQLFVRNQAHIVCLKLPRR